MGWGRVDPVPPALINNDPKGKKKGGERGKNGRKQGGKQRERETDSVEREKTETVETKNQGDREMQTGRRKNKGQNEQTRVA